MGDNGDIAKGSLSHHIVPIRTSRSAMLKLKTKRVKALTIEGEHFSMVHHSLASLMTVMRISLASFAS
jgi:hypothetical protein